MRLSPLIFILTACAGRATSTSCPTPTTTAAAAPAAVRPAGNELPKLAKLEGEWRGTGEGEPGSATVERTYRWVLGGKYLEVRNRSTYAPQPKNPKGEQHEDVGYISHDKMRKKLIARQFHVEGFVNQYVLESATPDTFVFVSEAIENIPTGFRARETLRLVGETQLEETFEIAEPDKDFAVYSKSSLSRAASSPASPVTTAR